MRTRAGRGRREILLVAVVALALTVVTGPVAQAWEHNCGKYPGSNPEISYRYYDMTSTFQTSFGEAQSNWDSTSAPGWFDYQPTNDDPMLEVRDGIYAWDDWARIEWDGCPFGLWLYNEVRVYFHLDNMAGFTSKERRRVAVHEIGHAYGLGHTALTCTTGPSVMKTGPSKFSCSGTAPWQDDVDGVVAKY